MALLGAARFFWTATRGSRLRPWRSEYLRWRVETFSGQKAETVGLTDCARLAWRERRQVLRFCGWLGEMHRLSRRREKGEAAGESRA